MPFDQRSLIHVEVWFPPCFVRQNKQKTNFFCAVILNHFQTKIFKSETTSRITFSHGFQISKKYWTSYFMKWGKKTFKKVPQKWTDRQTDILTYRKHWPRGPMLWKLQVWLQNVLTPPLRHCWQCGPWRKLFFRCEKCSYFVLQFITIFAFICQDLCSKCIYLASLKIKHW